MGKWGDGEWVFQVGLGVNHTKTFATKIVEPLGYFIDKVGNYDDL
jgi:hypothetical protein